MRVEIDSQSGFCKGVIRAISAAEEFLDKDSHGRLYSLGAIVHNESELERLACKGLVTIGKEDLEHIPDASGKTLLIRAHGEPPQTYARLSELGFNVIDCTCPVVLNLQKSISKAYDALHDSGIHGQLVIFGKIGHAEVLGLVGQVDGDALVVENIAQLDELISKGKLAMDGVIEVFSQTTMSPDGYDAVCRRLAEVLENPENLHVHRTICGQVASRHAQLVDFATAHDVIVFVTGKSSSNGKVLSDLCRSVNPRTYNVQSMADIEPEWFKNGDNVGVCGATSTPKWLLEQVASYIGNLQ